MLSVALATVLLALSVLHVYWAVGDRGLSTSVVPHVEGRPAFAPTRRATIVVAGGLAGAALVALVCGRIVPPPVAWLPWRPAGIGLGLVFLARAVGDFRLAGFFKRVRGTSFARWDTWLYSPLCVAMGVAFLGITL